MTNHQSRLQSLTKLVWFAAALLVVRVLVSILLEYRHYFPPNFDESFFLAGRRQSFAGLYAVGFYVHILSGPIALAGVLFMLASGKSNRFRQAHRIVGRIVVLTTFLAVCPGGLIMAMKTFAGPVAAIGFAAQAIAAGVAVVMTVYFARLKKIKRHWQWAYRSAILLCGPVLLRLGTGVFYVLDLESLNTYRFLSWASWLGPLLVYESVRLWGERKQ